MATCPVKGYIWLQYDYQKKIATTFRTKIAVKVLHECNMITRMFFNIFGGGICVWIDKHDLIGMINS